MTVTLDRRNPWETRPGWGIAVDLTPGEVVNARKVSGLKKMIVAGLILVLLLCAVAAGLALQSKWAAQDDYDVAQAETAALQAEARQYADITLMEATVASVDAQLATLMADDVDYVNLMAKVRLRVPPGLTITNLVILLAPEDPAAAAAAEGVEGAEGAEAAPPPPVGPATIGSLTIAGEGTAISALAPFVKDLSRLRGVVDVVPTSSSETEDGMRYTLMMNITDELYTHRFDAGVQSGAR